MALILWTDQAGADLINISEYISKDSPRYASIFIERIINATNILETHPRSGRIVPEFEIETLRELIVGNYRIVYSIVSEEQIDIITVHHSARILKL
jgi:toxin ParE1/3/4